jgi:hypothetical protein
VQGGLGIVRVVEEVKHVFDFFLKKGLKLIQTPNHVALSFKSFDTFWEIVLHMISLEDVSDERTVGMLTFFLFIQRMVWAGD